VEKIPYLHELGVNTVEFLPVWEFEEVESGRDAAGLYQVGSFTAGSRWAEWNGKFRDDLRGSSRAIPGCAYSRQPARGKPGPLVTLLCCRCGRLAAASRRP
jgi:pullulanase/glycogen debranching enzyme